MQNLDIILTDPELLNFIQSGLWRKNYFQQQLADAEHLQSESQAYPMQIERDSMSNGVEILCAFPGTTGIPIISGILFLKEDFEWSALSECDCSEGCDCTHSLAVMLKLTEEIQSQLNPQAPSSISDLSVVHWIHDLHHYAQKAQDRRTSSPSTSKANNQFLAYGIVLSNIDQKPSRLHLLLGRTLKSGTFIDATSTPSGDPQRPAKYMTSEDFHTCSLYRTALRYTYESSLPLMGDEAGAVLEAAEKTQRLFLINHPSNTKHEPIRITFGDTVTPKLAWAPNNDGSLYPTAGFEESETLLKCDPPYLFRPESNTLHPVDTQEVTSDMLSHWLDGPTIPSVMVDEIAPELKKIDFPAPETIQTKKLSAIQPTPQLHLHRDSLYHVSEMADKPAPIVADLTFSYHGHTHSPNLTSSSPAPDNFFVIDNNISLQIPCDQDFESQCVEMLTETLNLTFDYRMDTKATFFPKIDIREWDCDWANFTTHNCPRPRKRRLENHR